MRLPRFWTRPADRATLSIEAVEPHELPRKAACFGRDRGFPVACHSRACFMREIRARLMSREHANRRGHHHDVECKYTANQFPGNRVLAGGQAFDQSAHRCLLMEPTQAV